ncbi:MAG: phosphoserine phosphatase SerB [Hyphomicrobiales bacterium]|nr:MAG: phosphoserine phosphatase SerB [Hyphomicrobiales bacterium]
MTESAPILSLVAAPGSAGLVDAAIQRVAAVLGVAPDQGQCLAPAEAWEIALPAAAGLQEPLRPKLMAALDNIPVDVNLLAPRGRSRRKRLLVADMESTIIEQECLDELADYAGLRPRIAAITERAMRGELDFEAALKERVGLLAGLDARVLQEIYDDRVTLMPGAATLIATLRANGTHCALVSGGFTFYTERIAARLGFNEQQANTLDVAGGKITGTVASPILGREAKLQALQRLARQLGIDETDAMATGDGANDLAMIKAAGLGVAYRAKPIVAQEAQAAVRHGDLTALLYLQGYRKSEFVTA